jgi:hypothetical protein
MHEDVRTEKKQLSEYSEELQSIFDLYLEFLGII